MSARGDFLKGLGENYGAKLVETVRAALGRDASNEVVEAAVKREAKAAGATANVKGKSKDPPKKLAVKDSAAGSLEVKQPIKPASLSVRPTRAQQLKGARNPFMVSTRRPSAANYATQGDPDQTLLIQEGAALRENPVAFEKNMNMLAEEPFMADMAGASAEKISDVAERRGADNLKFIMTDLMPLEKVQAARLWYPTAQLVSQRAAARAGLPAQAGYGVTAVSSPQTPWDINVARLDRLMDMYGDRFETDPEAARRYIQKRLEMRAPGAIAQRGEAYAARIAATPFEELTDKFDQFARVTLADATRNNPSVPSINLDGSYGAPVGDITWGNGDIVSKALSIMGDPSMGNINAQLLGGGKVPSFYDNIADPFNEAPISTIDTHSAGAASLFPGGGGDSIVYRGMGLGPPKPGMPPAASDVARTGSKGLYGNISDMHTLAAREMGFATPREVQSATWEGVRDLWGQSGKTPQLKSAISDIWRNSTSPDDARFKIADLLGKPVRRSFQVK